MARFSAFLCRLAESGELIPIETVDMDCDAGPEAIDRAKRWGKEMAGPRPHIWLQVRFGDKAIATCEPGKF